MRGKLSLVSAIFVLVTSLAITGIAVSQPSDAILKVRQQFLDADINTLTFHSIDEIFKTGRVPVTGLPVI